MIHHEREFHNYKSGEPAECRPEVTASQREFYQSRAKLSGFLFSFFFNLAQKVFKSVLNFQHSQ
jgi:hypothetical protein